MTWGDANQVSLNDDSLINVSSGERTAVSRPDMDRFRWDSVEADRVIRDPDISNRYIVIVRRIDVDRNRCAHRIDDRIGVDQIILKDDAVVDGE